jgi:hypothetical protein
MIINSKGVESGRDAPAIMGCAGHRPIDPLIQRFQRWAVFANADPA